MKINKKLLTISLMTICLAISHIALAKSRPNIIVMLSDDQGWGDFSIHGNTDIETPNIDKLAESGAQFDRFFVCSLCAPTRAEFLTGRYYVRAGVYGVTKGAERINEDEKFISEIFQEAGYKTAAFGKWHSGMQYPYHPNARGFEEFYGFCSGHWGNYFDPMLDHNGDIITGKGYLTDDMTDRAMKYIESNRQSPFFVYLAFNTPHSPMQVPDRWWNKYKDKELKLNTSKKTRGNIDHTRAAYAMCENIDWNVGRLLKKLDELKLAENTIVVYFCDNGPNGNRWNGGMLGRKGSIEEGGVRSPLFVRWPGKIKPGTMVKPISAAFDLLPTLADMAEVKVSGTKPLDGITLKPLLLGNSANWPERTFFHSKKGNISVRTQHYRLSHTGKLFDMVKDGGQKKAVNDKMSELANTLKKKAEAWGKEALANSGVEFDKRPFIIGHPDAKMTQIPARDGVNNGQIERSSKYANDSYFTQWKSLEDSIVWNCEVGQSGKYKAEIFYTCPEADIGSTVELSFNESRVTGKITEAHDPPLLGMERDRVKRKESYNKDFKRMTLGEIELKKGQGTLTLKALEIPGSQVMDFRTLLLTRID